MITVIDNGDQTFTITLGDAADFALIQRAMKEHSPTIIAEVIGGWLRGERNYFDQKDKDAFKAKFDALSDADKDAILQKLG